MYYVLCIKTKSKERARENDNNNKICVKSEKSFKIKGNVPSLRANLCNMLWIGQYPFMVNRVFYALNLENSNH